MDQIQNMGGADVDARLSEYRELLAQFEAMRDRLRRAEEQRQSVPRRVYDRVRAEYDREMDALRSRMTPLRDELDQTRAELETSLKAATEERTAVEEELQELTFRFRIGEFAEEDMQSRRTDIDARIAAAQARIETVRASLTALDATGDRTPANNDAPGPDMPAVDDAPANDDFMTGNDIVTGNDVTTNTHILADAAGAAPVTDVEPAAGTPVPPAPEAPAHTAPAKRPTLRQTSADNVPVGFENPHDWIDEIGRDVARREAQSAPSPSSGTENPVATRANPAVTSPPSLVFVSGPHAGQSIPLLQTTLTIGREHDNNIEIKDVDVARYHARILNERGDFVVEDMGSTTGTWVNGEQTQRATLGHGDVIKIGQTEIAVDFEWASNSLERSSGNPSR
ncbi:MAG TPA: FHA domain-containing protein [Candidatus Krumholzibacteria bacterium]|nr:FHA domain-containing protein [Candidatus Krumholzibacteria bacterium]